MSSAPAASNTVHPHPARFTEMTCRRTSAGSSAYHTLPGPPDRTGGGAGIVGVVAITRLLTTLRASREGIRRRSRAAPGLLKSLFASLLECVLSLLVDPRVARVDLDQGVGDHRGGGGRANHLRSAGITYHGAHSVLVWLSISENAVW